MAHWRDGGIGNMAGSDDRPFEEWTLLERLDRIREFGSLMVVRMWVPPGDRIPADADSKTAQAAFDEIQRLRGGYPADLADLLTKLRIIAADHIGDGLASTPVQLLREAITELDRLRDHDWQPIDTAPVEPGHTVPSYYRFRCMLQDATGHVYEGAGYYVKVGRATTHLTLRWQTVAHRQSFPKYWKPLPAPKVTA